jgi:hypothetical protein
MRVFLRLRRPLAARLEVGSNLDISSPRPSVGLWYTPEHARKRSALSTAYRGCSRDQPQSPRVARWQNPTMMRYDHRARRGFWKSARPRRRRLPAGPSGRLAGSSISVILSRGQGDRSQHIGAIHFH